VLGQEEVAGPIDAAEFPLHRILLMAQSPPHLSRCAA